MKKEVLLISENYYGRKEYHEATEAPTSYNTGYGFIKKDKMYKDGRTYKVATDEDMDSYRKHQQEQDAISFNIQMERLIGNLEKVKGLVNAEFIEINNEEIEEEINDLISELKDTFNLNKGE